MFNPVGFGEEIDGVVDGGVEEAGGGVEVVDVAAGGVLAGGGGE